MTNFRKPLATCMLAATVVAVPALAAASDVVLEWNQIALAAAVTAGQGPNPQTRTMAIVHVAMHDAVNAITGKYRLYAPRGPVPLGASAEAAVIAAAHRSLRGLFGATQGTNLDAARQASLAARSLSETDPGIAFGESIAAAILAQRGADGASTATFPYTAPDAGSPGVWVPVGTAAPVLPGWGKVTPWVLRTATQFKPGRPYRLESKRYAADYDEVRQIGARVGSSRTGTQDEIARFWLGTPSVIWNGVARQVIEARQLSDSSAAQVLAHFYLAAADAGVATWEAKYRLNYWRPFTAIRNGHLDDNHRTDADPAWEAFLTTPQHPEFPSGHATNSGAMATVLMLAFGDKPGIPIVASSPTNPQFPRTWNRFSEAVAEVIDARIYSGFHFRRAMDAGARLGARVANYVVKNSLERNEHR
jgi:hypothetical protein